MPAASINDKILFRLIAFVVILIVFTWGCFQIFENLDAHKIMCIQSPISGKLTFHSTPGIKWQGFGKVTKYDRRSIYKFAYQIRFNDGGHATMNGSIQFDMPVDRENLIKIQSKFGTEDAVKTQLLQTVVNKCLYMTGPMMSSKESYAEKRNYLINYVEDQITNGIFKTATRETSIKDQLSGAEKTITLVEVVLKNGIPERQEDAVLKEFGIRAFNFSIETMPYDPVVEKQIQQQQSITMDVQTSMAAAKKAEQAAITAEANGKAAAASAKWEQEAEKSRAVTIGEKERDVAALKEQAAAHTKNALILEGQGEAEKQRLIMSANGNLDKKLEAWLQAQQAWAEAFSKYTGNIVPNYVAGSAGASSNGAAQFMEIMGMKAAKDLALDMSVKAK